MQTNPRRIRVHAVKLDREGWIGVGPTADRCDGHRHPTPELAKLCALHREGAVDADSNIVLLPVLTAPAAQQSKRRRLG